MSEFSPADYLVVSLAREIADGTTVATGVLSWLPMLAIGVARASHAPGAIYLNCAGAIDPPMVPFPSSSTAASLLRENFYPLPLTDLWDLAARGRLDLMFFGFGQLDRRGHTNLSWLNGRNGRGRKLAGVAGAFALRQLVKRPVLFFPRHSRSAFVSRVDARTTLSAGPSVDVITNLGRFQLKGGALRIINLHPTTSVEEVCRETGFPVRPSRQPPLTAGPEPAEQAALAQLDPEKTREKYVGR